jgi:RNA polymerase sigma-70 factor (ECF subfamily)
VPDELLPATLPDHLDSLRRAARGMTRHREDAEDLVQDTLLRVLARPRTIEAGGAGPYLHRALRNTHISGLRTSDRRPQQAPLEPEDVRLIAVASDPTDVIHSRHVIASIASLPAGQREVVAHVDVAGYGYAEAAQQLQIPVGTVMSRLHRGRARLANDVALAA